MHGKFVLVRCSDAGVYTGYYVEGFNRCVSLREARMIYQWNGANTINEVALRGIADKSNISEPVDLIVLLEACAIIPCTKVAEDNLRRSRWNIT